jgi:hypothetical protein
MANLLRESDDTSRFWYWQGASGRRYIHSVYAVGACPPLPGAIYVAVKRTGTLRTALGVGRFSVLWDGAARRALDHDMIMKGANEIHVHLLAEGEEAAKFIFNDLREALHDGGPVTLSRHFETSLAA